MIRGILALPLIAAYTVAVGLTGTLCGLLGQGRAAHTLSVLWGRAILWTVGIRVTVTGAEHCPRGPAVFASNHASALDIPILFGHLPAHFHFIHKRSLYALPVIGLYLYATGHVPIDRGSAFRARKSLERAAARIRAGTSVLVFPEGTRSRGEEVGPFKRGGFTLAIEAGVPVVPLSLVGVKQVARGGLRLAPGKVRVLVHPPVSTTQRRVEEAALLADEVQGIVASGCEAA